MVIPCKKGMTGQTKLICVRWTPSDDDWSPAVQSSSFMCWLSSL
jgi:hypothetical protein